MPSRRNNNPRLAAELADYAQARADQLGLAFSRYIAILIWNDVQVPGRDLPQVQETGSKLVRTQVSLYLESKLRGQARKAARARGIPILNRYIDRLIQAEKDSGAPGLEILPAARSKRPK